MAGRVFEHFNGLYRFQGLRRYKENIAPIGNLDFSLSKALFSVESMLKVMRVIRHK